MQALFLVVIPAKAGIQRFQRVFWMPAFAGMTAIKKFVQSFPNEFNSRPALGTGLAIRRGTRANTFEQPKPMTVSKNPIAPERLLWEETIPGGGHWSGVLARGTSLRLVDLDGGANVAALFFNRDEKLERYNMPDTLKAQHTAHLTRGHVCYSDMGRVLCSITNDSLGWHDPLGMLSTAESCRKKYGERSYQQYRNDMIRSGRDGLLIELGKWGLGQRDLVAGVNFFSKVVADVSGRVQFVPNHSSAGAFVDLRFEMNVLVALSTAPHALDPNPRWEPKPVQLIAWRSDPPGEDDYCRNFRPENRRGFTNTERLFR